VLGMWSGATWELCQCSLQTWVDFSFHGEPLKREYGGSWGGGGEGCWSSTGSSGGTYIGSGEWGRKLCHSSQFPLSSFRRSCTSTFDKRWSVTKWNLLWTEEINRAKNLPPSIGKYIIKLGRVVEFRWYTSVL
jgi:hypothetical protein